MAYEKQTWTTGEVITQEKLNHMEDGIANAYELPAVTETDNGKVLGVENGAWSVVNGGGGTLVVNVTITSSESGTSMTLDKTWQEIYDASLTCSVVARVVQQNQVGVSFWRYAPLEALAHNPSASSNAYEVYLSGNEMPFRANSPSDYPRSMNFS